MVYNPYILLSVQIFSAIVITLFLVGISHVIIKRTIKKINAKNNNKLYLLHIFLKSLKAPSKFFIFIVGCDIIVNLISSKKAFVISDTWVSVMTKTNDMLIIVVILWLILRIISNLELHFLKSKAAYLNIDKTTIDIFAKLLSVFTISIGALFLMHILGVELKTILAFGGIGGVAVAWAFKDFFSSMVATLLLYFDRPFVIGDSIKLFDRKILPVVEGDVEKISWRFTQIRTRNKKIVCVPNTYLITGIIENSTKLSHYTIFLGILVQYSSLSDINEITSSIKGEMADINETNQVKVDLIGITNGTVRLKMTAVIQKHAGFESCGEAEHKTSQIICNILKKFSLKFEVDVLPE